MLYIIIVKCALWRIWSRFHSKLSLVGAGDYWDDADRWIRNMLVEGQLTDVNWVGSYFESPYCKAATAYDREHRDPNLVGMPYVGYLQKKFPAVCICTDNVAQRNVGCFGGWIAMNDWFGGYNIGTGGMHGPRHYALLAPATVHVLFMRPTTAF